MPYKVEQTASCPVGRSWGVVKEDGELMGCHTTRVEAEQQRQALYANEPVIAKYEQIDFSPPQGVRDEAEKGLEWRREFNRGGTGVGVARARDLSNGKNISPETARRMKAYFDRHESDKKGEGFSPGEEGFPSAGRIAWALWGGDAGQAWANKLVRQMNAEDNAKAAVMAEGNANEIKLYGPIGYPGVTAEEFKRRLEIADPAKPLLIRIDSEGGSVFDGMSIHDAIAAWPAGSKAVIESAAFSIASFIPMAADSIEITSNGYLMLHNPYTETQGDDDDHAKMSDLLKKLKSSMVEAYAERTGKSSEEVQEIMKAETWFTAKEAMQAGLVDSVLGKKQSSQINAAKTNMPQRVVASLIVSGDSIGDRLPIGENKMASDKVAATAKSIKAKYGKTVSSDFIVKALEEEMSMEDVGEKLVEELMSQNDELMSKLAAMEEEVKALRAAAEEVKMKAQEEMQPKEEPAMKARGIAPVRAGAVVPMVNASGKWNDLVAKYTDKGVSKADAVRRVNRENPGLRDEMLRERVSK